MVTMLGFFLSMQLIYKGTNDHCLPKGVSFPDDFDDIPKTIEAVSPKLSNIWKNCVSICWTKEKLVNVACVSKDHAYIPLP